MSDDVSVARPARVVVASHDVASPPGLASATQHHGTWTVGALALWELYFGVAFGGVLVHSLVASGQGSVADQIIVGGLLLAMFVWYVGLGRRIVKADNADWRGYLFMAGLFVLFVSGTALMGSMSYLLFALCPLTYMALPLRAAHVAVVAFSLTPSAVFFAKTGDLKATVTILLPISLIAITVSVIMAITTSRTEQLSSRTRRPDQRARVEPGRGRPPLPGGGHRRGAATPRRRDP